MSRGSDGLARIERELQAERAAALTRVATTLEGLVTRLYEIQRRLETAASPNERDILNDAYVRTRSDALRYRWYLEVQREAVGLTCHTILEAHYAIPRPPAEP